MGTPLYFSPEICTGEKYDEKSDIWSLGCVLFEVTKLELPFFDSNQLTLAHKICRAEPAPLPSHYSQQLRDLIMSMLEKAPAKRPAAADVLAHPAVRAKAEALSREMHALLTADNGPLAGHVGLLKQQARAEAEQELAALRESHRLMEAKLEEVRAGYHQACERRDACEEGYREERGRREQAEAACEEARTQRDAAQRKLHAEQRRVSELDGELHGERERRAALEAELGKAQARANELDGKLGGERERREGLEVELGRAEARATDLESTLHAERERREALEAELDREQGRAKALEGELHAERERAELLEGARGPSHTEADSAAAENTPQSEAVTQGTQTTAEQAKAWAADSDDASPPVETPGEAPDVDGEEDQRAAATAAASGADGPLVEDEEESATVRSGPPHGDDSTARVDDEVAPAPTSQVAGDSVATPALFSPPRPRARSSAEPDGGAVRSSDGARDVRGKRHSHGADIAHLGGGTPSPQRRPHSARPPRAGPASTPRRGARHEHITLSALDLCESSVRVPLLAEWKDASAQELELDLPRWGGRGVLLFVWTRDLSGAAAVTCGPRQQPPLRNLWTVAAGKAVEGARGQCPLCIAVRRAPHAVAAAPTDALHVTEVPVPEGPCRIAARAAPDTVVVRAVAVPSDRVVLEAAALAPAARSDRLRHLLPGQDATRSPHRHTPQSAPRVRVRRQSAERVVGGGRGVEAEVAKAQPPAPAARTPVRQSSGPLSELQLNLLLNKVRSYSEGHAGKRRSRLPQPVHDAADSEPGHRTAQSAFAR